jgi:folate-binding protein YgfZ
MTIHLRADRALFRFSGSEAHKLLNDVLTGPIPAGEGPAAWWALLSPQGKILAEGTAGWAEDGLLVDLHQSVADDFFKRMRMYRLRAQVDIADLRESHRVGFAETAPSGLVSHADRRGAVSLGWRVVAPLAASTDWSDDTAYARARIGAGIAEQGADFPANDSFAHDIALDLLDGVDFRKGCYVGQEVVSRMKHRGTARRRPVIVSGVTAPAGSAVVAGGREAGSIGQVVEGQAVAIVRLDLTLPGWAPYRFGETPAEK